MANCPAVWVPPGRVSDNISCQELLPLQKSIKPETQKSVVQYRSDEVGFSRENHQDCKGLEENLVECDQSEDVPGLELHEADEHPGAPPGVLAEVVQQGERIGGEVEESEEKDGDQDQSDGGGVQEQHGEYQVVGRVLRQEQAWSDSCI